MESEGQVDAEQNRESQESGEDSDAQRTERGGDEDDSGSDWSRISSGVASECGSGSWEILRRISREEDTNGESPDDSKGQSRSLIPKVKALLTLVKTVAINPVHYSRSYRQKQREVEQKNTEIEMLKKECAMWKDAAEKAKHQTAQSHLSNTATECVFCKEKKAKGDLRNSHLVPECVLNYLCRWKAGKYLGRNEQKKYIFRTDIECGIGVSARACTTRNKAYLCDVCELRMDSIDKFASNIWKHLCTNDTGIPNNPSSEPCMDIKVVLFSMMARGMFISLSRIPNNCKFALHELMNDTDTETFKDTTAALNKYGFMWYPLLPNRKRYRVEFPFFCVLELNMRRINVVCAQVPPFFCIMPENSEHTGMVRSYLPNIVIRVHVELKERLRQFLRTARTDYNTAQEKAKYLMERNFIQWCEDIYSTEFEDLYETGPVLVFKYLDDTLRVKVDT